MSDDNGEELEKLAEQQESILVAIAGIKDQLDASEWRRQCLLLLASINRTADNLRNNIQKRLPGRDDFPSTGFLGSLDCYANLVFKSAQDIRTVYRCFILIADILEEAEKSEMPFFMDIWPKIHPLIDELDTLESGDPPLITVSEKRMRSLQPELQDAEREAVRKRFEQRVSAGIHEGFARRKAEAEEYY
jgi:hypothetical protein